jgi:hypothetical protein
MRQATYNRIIWALAFGLCALGFAFVIGAVVAICLAGKGWP